MTARAYRNPNYYLERTYDNSIGALSACFDGLRNPYQPSPGSADYRQYKVIISNKNLNTYYSTFLDELNRITSLFYLFQDGTPPQLQFNLLKALSVFNFCLDMVSASGLPFVGLATTPVRKLIGEGGKKYEQMTTANVFRILKEAGLLSSPAYLEYLARFITIRYAHQISFVTSEEHLKKLAKRGVSRIIASAHIGNSSGNFRKYDVNNLINSLKKEHLRYKKGKALKVPIILGRQVHWSEGGFYRKPGTVIKAKDREPQENSSASSASELGLVFFASKEDAEAIDLESKGQVRGKVEERYKKSKGKGERLLKYGHCLQPGINLRKRKKSQSFRHRDKAYGPVDLETGLVINNEIFRSYSCFFYFPDLPSTEQGRPASRAAREVTEMIDQRVIQVARPLLETIIKLDKSLQETNKLLQENKNELQKARSERESMSSRIERLESLLIDLTAGEHKLSEDLSKLTVEANELSSAPSVARQDKKD